MPSTHNTIISPTIELTISEKMIRHCCNEIGQHSSPQDILNSQAKKWQTQLTSEAFASKLDENDPLRCIRDEFYIPKIGGLPKGIYIYILLFHIQHYLLMQSIRHV
jgi:hypothetical protein